jgi:hypothetical protein
MPYTLYQVATNKVTGEVFFIVTANTPKGIQDFREDFENPQTINNLNQLPNRSDWQMNMFPDVDDGQTDFETLVVKGVARMSNASADRQYRRDAAARVRVLEEQEKSKARETDKMYRGQN